MYDVATYFAWFVLALLSGLAVAAIVWIGSLPKQMAMKRNHPQVSAINALSWFGLLFGGVGWVIAFVWALLRSGPIGHPAGSESTIPLDPTSNQRVDELNREMESLKSKVAQLESQLSRFNVEEKET